MHKENAFNIKWCIFHKSFRKTEKCKNHKRYLFICLNAIFHRFLIVKLNKRHTEIIFINLRKMLFKSLMSTIQNTKTYSRTFPKTQILFFYIARKIFFLDRVSSKRSFSSRVKIHVLSITQIFRISNDRKRINCHWQGCEEMTVHRLVLI